jgi:hypothetical protein
MKTMLTAEEALTVHKPPPQDKLAEPRALYFRRLFARADFADEIAIARKVWRKYPRFVECEQFPEPYLSAAIERNSRDHETYPPHPEAFELNDDCLADDFEGTLAAELAGKRSF